MTVLAAALLLAAILVQQFGASLSTSAVVDEPAHLTAGYLSLKRGDLSMNREHPPLLKALAALPLLFMDPVLPPVNPEGPAPGSEDFEFDFSRRFLYHANDADRLLRSARVPIMLLTLALGVIVFLWAREIAGDAAALAATVLYAFEPNILAHGRLVTTDLGAAAFCVAFLWAARRSCRNGGLGWALICGVFLGCALLSKFSALLVLPAGALLIVMERFLPAAGRDAGALGGITDEASAPQLSRAFPAPSWARLAAIGVVVASVSWFMLEAGYGFGGFPVPKLYLEGLELARLKNATVEGPTYLMGAISAEGFPAYFLVALFVKTPLALLALALIGIVAIAGPVGRRREAAWLIVPAAAWLVAMTLLTRAQLGLRYVLPVTPLLCIAAGVGFAALLHRSSAVTIGGPAVRRKPSRWTALFPVVAVALVVWPISSAALIYPSHLAYFNELAGGPENGRRWLVDSNLDWGQDLIGLSRWLRESGEPPINLYYFGTADPDFYALRRHSPALPLPGIFAVSATHLSGVYLSDPDYLAAFRDMDPITTIGHSILIYRVEVVPERLRRPLRRDGL